MKVSKIISFLFFFPLVILFSCTPDENDPDITDARDKFTGSWTVNETCNRNTYPVTIIPDPDHSNRVIIQNFWLIGFNEKAPYGVVSGNEITIPKQFMCDNNANEVEGSGFIENNKINWTYQVNDGADLNFCNATYTR